LKEYNFYYRGIKYERFGNGNINKTYLVYGDKKYILQEINNFVFENPIDVITNCILISDFLNKNDYKTINLIRNNKEEYITIFDDNGLKYFRCYEFIECYDLYEIPKNEKMFYEAGKKIGSFSKTLKDFNKGDIINTIDNFHNVEESYNKFIKAFNENKYFRKKFCLIECNIAIKNKFCYNIINKEYINGNIPKRLVHYDTKISNILFNEKDEAVAVIDLDTVMVGLLIYDYADAVRCGISNLKEDDRKINNMKLKYNMFEVFTLGFLESCIDIITDREINLLVSALEVITYECGIRFLTDFLNNDIYFKTNYCNHNLIRARNQLHLYLKIVESEEKLKKIVQKCLVKVIKNNELK